MKKVLSTQFCVVFEYNFVLNDIIFFEVIYVQYNRIKDLREDRDASQRQVAEALGLYTTTYARYERGEQEVPFCIAIALAKFYNVSLDYLAGLTNEPRKLN